MASRVLQVLKDFSISGALVAFSYFVIPFLLPDPFHQGIYFSIVVSVTNFLAIILSWIYFSHTRCYDDEGNFVTMIGYKIFGASSTHFVVFISRIVGNIVLVLSLVLSPDMLDIELYLFIIYFKPVLLTVCITTSMYTYEMINNIYGVTTGLKYTCKDKSLVCGMMKKPDPFFCDFPNDKDEVKEVPKVEAPSNIKELPFIGNVLNALEGKLGETFGSKSKRDMCLF